MFTNDEQYITSEQVVEPQARSTVCHSFSSSEENPCNHIFCWRGETTVNDGNLHLELNQQDSLTVCSDDDDSPIQAFLRSKNHDSLSSTLHTDITTQEDDFDGDSFNEEDHYTGNEEHEDDVSITDEFFAESIASFEHGTIPNMTAVPTTLNNLDDTSNNSYGCEHSMKNDGPIVGLGQSMQESYTDPPIELGGSMASLSTAFEKLNKCMERSSETRAIIKELSASSPDLLQGVAAHSDFLMQVTSRQPLLPFGNSSFPRLTVRGHGSMGRMPRKYDAGLRLSSSSTSLSEMKRSGIAPRKASNSALSTGLKRPKTVLSLALRNRLLRDLYSVSAKAKKANEKK